MTEYNWLDCKSIGYSLSTIKDSKDKNAGLKFKLTPINNMKSQNIEFPANMWTKINNDYVAPINFRTINFLQNLPGVKLKQSTVHNQNQIDTLDPGEVALFTPIKDKHLLTLTGGIIVEQVRSMSDNIGYNVKVFDSENPYRIDRFWLSQYAAIKIDVGYTWESIDGQQTIIGKQKDKFIIKNFQTDATYPVTLGEIVHLIIQDKQRYSESQDLQTKIQAFTQNFKEPKKTRVSNVLLVRGKELSDMVNDGCSVIFQNKIRMVIDTYGQTNSNLSKTEMDFIEFLQGYSPTNGQTDNIGLSENERLSM